MKTVPRSFCIPSTRYRNPSAESDSLLVNSTNLWKMVLNSAEQEMGILSTFLPKSAGMPLGEKSSLSWATEMTLHGENFYCAGWAKMVKREGISRLFVRASQPMNKQIHSIPLFVSDALAPKPPRRGSKFLSDRQADSRRPGTASHHRINCPASHPDFPRDLRGIYSLADHLNFDFFVLVHHLCFHERNNKPNTLGCQEKNDQYCKKN